MSQPFAISSGEITAQIDPLGAELVSLTDAAGREYMSNGDPRWWTGRAPVLFPIVGALRNDRYRLDGQEYPLAKHGFARKSAFVCEEHEPYEWVRFALSDDAATRAAYPFAFRLEIFHRVWGGTLTTTATVTNRDTRAMPFSFGFHPAFAWPLPGGAAKEDHRVVFEHAEPQPIRRLSAQGQLLPETFPSPVEGDTLAPDAALFEADALVWDNMRSRACSFGTADGASLALEWDNCPMLGIWQKPGAPFLCIEPWQGIADPIDFACDFRDKPGVVELAPGADARFTLAITLSPPEDSR
ncbi:Aldose 1-epimerase [Tsuneonella dongtanensis]|uniref:Aldose 1-epimerase n=1 Tax=Tsuneonella dongtanensis TaxID=692370 RepID=A0A1B2AAE0_9SPHN|nr:aldose 1-epimerase family protein [Tsuneonella dongtanensis]ANY19106.1 Aldose 1-epimerase [Tsuneonella dongtanensis]